MYKKKKALSSVRELVPDIDDRAFLVDKEAVKLKTKIDIGSGLTETLLEYAPDSICYLGLITLILLKNTGYCASFH